jgi:YD repeat-containing protein
VKNAIASMEIRKVTSGVEQVVSRTEYAYDNPSAPANLTQVRTWDSVKGAYSNPLTTSNSLTATTEYNQYGMPTLVTDERGLKTSTTYGQIGSAVDLYPTEIKSAYQTALVRTEKREYHLSTGLVTKITDVDNNVSTVNTFDPLGRPTLVKAAEGKPEEARTGYEYADAQRRLITRSDLTAVGDGKLVTIEQYDQLGRVRLRRQLEDAASQSATDETTGIKVQTRYRLSGSNSFVLVSNPYRAATSGAATAEPTMGWTRSKSDNAGRTIEVQTFGGVGLPAPWGANSTGTVTSAYDANFTIVTDQAQKQRRSMTDGLGRLIRVDEPDLNSNLGTTTAPNQPTHYAYDVLGNLTEVTQSDSTTTQLRTFVYSSLSRLTQATNPESGTITYKYGESGNLTVRTDARAVSTHYAYDALNRITRRWYNGSSLTSDTVHNQPAIPASVGTTNEVKFYYDQQSLPTGAPSYVRGTATGRLVAQTYGTGSNGDYFAYDNLGRATLKYQQTGTVNYQMGATYNRASAITAITYPSGRTVSHSFDPAGRLMSFTGSLGDGATRTYSSGILYSSLGALVKEQFGTTTPIYNKLFYNSRGQLAEIRESTSYTGPTDTTSDRGAIINNYSASCTGVCSGSSMTDNNGNLKKQEIHIPGHTMRWQEYAYDSLNRLSSAREVLNGGAEQWKQAFTYDRWGNRTINTGVTYGTGINNKLFTVNTANNRLGVPGGQPGVMQYDAAGNLTNDTYSGAGNRTYDGENKITSAWGGNNQAQLYGYDASGQRIKRTVDGVETWQVYGLGGELLAEYPASGAAVSPQKEYGYRNGQLLVTANGNTGVLTNFALGKTATQSSTHASGATASRAVDGNTDGVFANGSVTHTLNDLNAWWQVDLGQVKTIDTIRIWNRVEFPERLTNFYVFVSDQPFTSTSLTTTLNQAGVSNYHTAGQVGFPTQLTINRTGRYIRVQLGGTNYLSIAELQVLGIAAPANLALNKTATQSSTHASGAVAGRAVDGNTNGVFTSNSVTHTLNDVNAWWQVDLGQVETIGIIKVWNRVEFPERLSNFYVFVSDQPFTSTDLTTTQNQAGVSSYSISAQCGFPTELGIDRTGRYVRVQLAGTNYLSIAEVQVWTGSIASPIKWLVSDHLGTPRMIFDRTGAPANMSRHDYLPFGEELFAPTGGRSAAMGYSGGDGVRQQFTSKERDVETGLDYFLARYYASIQGRFI